MDAENYACNVQSLGYEARDPQSEVIVSILEWI